MALKNFTEDKNHKTIQELFSSAEFITGVESEIIFLSALNIFLSIAAFLGNTLILVALHKETSLHPPSKLLYRNLAITDLCVGIIAEPLFVTYLTSVVNERWYFFYYAHWTASFSGLTLCVVSLLTMTAISVDRLLALLLGLRYRQVVTFRRTCITVTGFWILSIVGASTLFWNRLITSWFQYNVAALCLVTTTVAYTKVFCTLRHNQIHVQNHAAQGQPSQAIQLNIARYRKAVYSALWVQGTLVICYLPYVTVVALQPQRGMSLSIYNAQQFTTTLVYLNSSLNPFLYCWKIREVRQAVRVTLRQLFCRSNENQKKVAELYCSAELFRGVDGELIFLSALNVFLSIAAFLGNTLILVALRKETSLHPPSKLLYRNLAITDLCVGIVTEPLFVTYWTSVVNRRWDICHYTRLVLFFSGSTLCYVSLLTLTAISVDRLLALLLGHRYRQVVTLKRTHIAVTGFWILSIVGASTTLWNTLITLWFQPIFVALCLMTTMFAYTKIFLSLRQNQIRVQNHVAQGQPSQPIPLNIARYRKAVYSALWVQGTLGICYLPYNIAVFLTPRRGMPLSIYLARNFTVSMVLLNSSLNPLLYCWKIREVRQAVKETLRQVFCRSS
ncbi:unnamed protein product [Porites evermanni]|uniref:G-protein coupled receptors family 1 profile domain-containing protein n=1 Tax=Porites evermanni TaxID=104178 RepID=A0ABN8T2C3_9CNID|nr:unnamed protein product [Porites evermanni]